MICLCFASFYIETTSETTRMQQMLASTRTAQLWQGRVGINEWRERRGEERRKVMR